MLKSLCIKNLATIDDLEIMFNNGFSILTGETGAGKSIIIDGVRVILGEKGSSDMVRTGKDKITVEGIFEIERTERKGQADLTSSSKEYLVQRIIPKSGNAKGYINGTLVPLKKLKQQNMPLADIFGQNDHVFLRKIDRQLDYLDHFAQALPLREKTAGTAQELRKALHMKIELEEKTKERAQRLDFLEYQIKEIKKAQLRPDEEKKIHQERHILKNAEKINSLIHEALEISHDREDSISSLAIRLQTIVTHLSEFENSFQETGKEIDQFTITIKEFSDTLLKFKENQTASPDKLENIEGRLSQIENLKRKYGPTVEDIFSYLETITKEHKDLLESEETQDELDAVIEKLFKEYKIQTKELAQKRIQSARLLENSLAQETSLLGMKKAKFHIALSSSDPVLEPDKIKDKGTEDVEFLISTNPGEELKPLRKIASGGELSRIMLALKSIGKEKGWNKTLIFDEIDSGIGGKVAEFVAHKLQRLSENNQVICITHLPQIASYAADHFKIDKEVEKGRTYTTIRKLSFEERVEEIARLMAGTHITETSLKNAKEMLNHNLKKGS